MVCTVVSSGCGTDVATISENEGNFLFEYD